VTHAVVRSNHTTGVGVAVAIGRVDTFRNVALSANDVMIDHNYFDTGVVAASIEAGNGIHFVNNVVDGYASDTVVLGKSPKNVVIANNLFLGASTTAFVVRDPAVLRLFDFNVFSTADEAIKVEVGSETITLQNFLARQTMTHTTQIRGVHFLDRDLGRIAGVDTVDRGTRVGIAFKGAAPDLGVAER